MSLFKRKRKMADGGVVKPKTLGETIGYPKRMAKGGLVEEDDEDEAPRSIAAAIRAKKQEIEPEDPLDQLEPEFEELNEEAGEVSEEDPLSADEGDDDFKKQNRIAAIRRKRMRG